MGEQPRMTCPCCGGAGTVPLPVPLRQILDLLGEQPLTVRDLREKLPPLRARGRRVSMWPQELVHQRLRQLSGVGLARPAGKERNALLWVRA